jgi:hypothetical protein
LLDVACLLGGLGLLHVFTDLADAFLLGWVQRAGGNLLQVGICRGQQLGGALALAGGLCRTYAGGQLDRGIDRAAVSHDLFLRGRGRSARGSLPVATLLGRRLGWGRWVLRRRFGVRLLRLLRGRWRRRGLRRRWLRRFCRRTTLRGILRRIGWRRHRRLRLLAELLELRWEDGPCNRWSQQRKKSENGGQIRVHVKFGCYEPTVRAAWNSIPHPQFLDYASTGIHPALTVFPAQRS